MKITMYELLGMVKDGKTPKKIKYDNRVYIFDDTKDNYYENETSSINWDYVAIYCLNEQVEILEEEKKIPEKLDDFDIQGLEVSGYSMTQAEYLLEDGVKENRKIINWILDYLKSKGE